VVDVRPAAIPAPADVAAPPEIAQKTKSGLFHRRLRAGRESEKPRAWDRVAVRYTGWTTDGVMFDSTEGRIEPAELELDKVIPGWAEALQLMSVGEKQRLWVPEELAYKGRAGVPRGMLVFDLELIEVERSAAPPPVPKDVGAAPSTATRTASGLACRVLKRGRGKRHPSGASRVRVHFTGWTTDGRMFDSSVTRGKPESVLVSQGPWGWSEALQQMVEGEEARCWVPEALAHAGSSEAPPGMLIFDLELLAIER
jgi:peptidylprolyl isomerase